MNFRARAGAIIVLGKETPRAAAGVKINKFALACARGRRAVCRAAARLGFIANDATIQ